MRSKAKHDEWQKLLQWKIITLDGAKELQENFQIIKEELEKQCTALMIVIPKDVEEKYKDRSSDFRSFSNSFRVRINDEGERAKVEGIQVGKNMIMSRGIEATCWFDNERIVLCVWNKYE